MNIIASLRAALGDAAVLDGQSAGERHASDRSGSGTKAPLAVVRPRSTADVSTALRLCNEAGVSVIPQGGMTGLAGGGNPQGGEIVIS